MSKQCETWYNTLADTDESTTAVPKLLKTIVTAKDFSHNLRFVLLSQTSKLLTAYNYKYYNIVILKNVL